MQRDSLFIEELDGPTYTTLDDAVWAYEMELERDNPLRPIWSNYGGWVA